MGPVVSTMSASSDESEPPMSKRSKCEGSFLVVREGLHWGRVGEAGLSGGVSGDLGGVDPVSSLSIGVMFACVSGCEAGGSRSLSSSRSLAKTSTNGVSERKLPGTDSNTVTSLDNMTFHQVGQHSR